MLNWTVFEWQGFIFHCINQVISSRAAAVGNCGSEWAEQEFAPRWFNWLSFVSWPLPVLRVVNQTKTTSLIEADGLRSCLSDLDHKKGVFVQGHFTSQPASYFIIPWFNSSLKHYFTALATTILQQRYGLVCKSNSTLESCVEENLEAEKFCVHWESQI